MFEVHLDARKQGTDRHNILLYTNSHSFCTQVEVSKKREAECARLRKEIEDVNAMNEEAFSSSKAKFNAALVEAQDEAENLKKAKAR